MRLSPGVVRAFAGAVIVFGTPVGCADSTGNGPHAAEVGPGEDITDVAPEADVPDGPDLMDGPDGSLLDSTAAETASEDVDTDTATLAVLDDDFEGDELDPAWSVVHPELAEVTVSGGALHVNLIGFALWFQASEGVLVHKTVTGDFKATATVRVRSRTAPDEPPAGTIHLGGLMARDPASEGEGAENYLFVVVGRDEDDLSVETKYTANSESDYLGPSWPSGDAELRLCRVGDAFRLFKRAIGDSGPWTEAKRYDAPLADALQVGIGAYAPAGEPDITVHVDGIRFEPVAAEAACLID